ncbi:MAG: hypothetical protein J6W75_03955 [Bacteroidaceae bacterium]|nr:hypothetical protein [Bacteroidaceae bacterium]
MKNRINLFLLPSFDGTIRTDLRRGLLFLILHFSLFTLCLLSSCDDYDIFTTDRSAVLTFSRDTIAFDTLLVTVPSSTQTLIVHNIGDKGLRISDIQLEGGAGSLFRINIDGQDMSRSQANHVQDFEIRRRDSIIVRAEVTIPSFDEDQPRNYSDALLFTLESGIQQRILLTVVGQEAWFLNGHTVKTDTTFATRRPIVIYDSLVVAENATLTILSPTRLFFHDGASLIVHGQLQAQGSFAQPVVMRGDRTDHMFDYLPYDRLPGRWGGVHLTAESSGNKLDYVDLHGGSFGIRCDSSDVASTKLILTNSRLHQLGGDGLSFINCHVEVANTEISNTQGHCVWFCGGDATFTHCTLAQFYPLDANRGFALDFSITQGDGIYHPLERADFVNCVITGYGEDVLLMPSLDRQVLPSDVAEIPINYRFHHCFLTTTVPEGTEYSDRFVDCTLDDLKAELNREKHFQSLDTHLFLYDFTPIEASPIRAMADSMYSILWPADRLGHLRLMDGSADAGCYEFVGNTK